MDTCNGLDVGCELANARLCAFDAREEVLAAEGLRSRRLHAVVSSRLVVCRRVVHRHVGMRYVGWLCVCAGLRILRWLRIVGIATTLEGRRRAELLSLAVILFRRVSLLSSGRVVATAYSSVIGVG